MSSVSRLQFLAAVCILLLWPVRAQVSAAELIGTVVDSSGGSIAGTKATVTNADTGVSREAASDVAGSYVFTLLPPGSYSLSVEAPRFRKHVQSGVSLEVDQRARLDITMQAGQVTEFNHPQFGQPNGSVENTQAGRITSTVGNPRQLQVALRVQW